MSRRAKRQGRFCWCCGRMRPNERFSGRGLARHVCKDCVKLGPEELSYRQAVRDIDRTLDWDGLVRRKQRKSFERFLAHPDERIRRYAEEVRAHDESTREMYRQEQWALGEFEAPLEEMLGMRCPHCGGWISFQSDEEPEAGASTPARSMSPFASGDEELPF